MDAFHVSYFAVILDIIIYHMVYSSSYDKLVYQKSCMRVGVSKTCLKIIAFLNQANICCSNCSFKRSIVLFMLTILIHTLSVFREHV